MHGYTWPPPPALVRRDQMVSSHLPPPPPQISKEDTLAGKALPKFVAMYYEKSS